MKIPKQTHRTGVTRFLADINILPAEEDIELPTVLYRRAYSAEELTALEDYFIHVLEKTAEELEDAGWEVLILED